MSYICPYLRAVNPNAKVSCRFLFPETSEEVCREVAHCKRHFFHLQASHLLILAKAKWLEAQDKDGKAIGESKEGQIPDV